MTHSNTHTTKPEIRNGFTIVELMISLSVLSVLLTISAITLLNLGRTYVKGTNDFQVQNIARNLTSEISDQIRLGTDTPIIISSGNQGTICIGTNRYSYLVGDQVESSPTQAGQTLHALWRDKIGSSSTCSLTQINMQSQNPTDPSNSGRNGGEELIPENMRLTTFQVQQNQTITGLWRVVVGVAYGGSDLLCNFTVSDNCDPSQMGSQAYLAQHIHNLERNNINDQIGCVSGIGHQFCAVSTLSVSVVRRLTSE